MPPLRQGDVIIVPYSAVTGLSREPLPNGNKLPHLTLAKGEVTGHSHRISEGKAELYERDGTLYLKVRSPTALLTHEEHESIAIPQGDWIIRIQREYEPFDSSTSSEQRTLRAMPQGWRYVAD